jgi:2-polyprenyl-3-methyl-5-hydroxy-6-metoxy-1,4-benzoquinol methylase
MQIIVTGIIRQIFLYTHPERMRLKLLPKQYYQGVNPEDPIRYYFWPVLGNLYRRRLEICLSKCTGGERVLDIGFGSGIAFLNLSEMYKEIHGIDLTADAEVVARTFNTQGIFPILRQGSVLELPYPDNTFDTVVSVSILEHLQPAQLQRALQESWRVLKPGGQMVYGTPVERPLMVFMFRLLRVDIRDHHFSTERAIYLAAQAVFGEGKKEDLRPFGGILGSLYEIGVFQKPK